MRHSCGSPTRWASPVDVDDAMEAIHATERIRSHKLYHPMRDDTIGRLLRVTIDERTRLSIRTIAAFDESKEQADERIRTSATQRQARWRANG